MGKVKEDKKDKAELNEPEKKVEQEVEPKKEVKKEPTEEEKQTSFLQGIMTRLGWIVFFLILIFIMGILIYIRMGNMRLY